MKHLFYIITIISVFGINNLFAKSVYDYSSFPEKDVTKFLDKYVQFFGPDIYVKTQLEINDCANKFIEVYELFLQTYIKSYTDNDKKLLLKKFDIALQKIIADHNIQYKKAPKKTLERLLTDVYSQVDEHTFMLFGEDLKKFYMDISPSQFGIPIDFSVSVDGGLIITNIYNNEMVKAGIRHNDKIIAINDILLPSKKNYKGKYIDKQHYEKLTKFRDSLNKLVKENNASIKLTIENNGVKKDIILKGSEFSIPPVSSMVIDKKYLYINISSFMEEDVFLLFIKALEDNNVNKSKGLIIDLRNNAGGITNSSAAIANTMLSNKLFIKTITNNNTKIKNFGGIKYSNVETITTTPDVIVNENIPIIILINSYTVSAAEMLAGSLALNHRATLIGEDTFGKWLVQYIYNSNDALLAITNAAVYLENDITFQGDGISPDIFIKSQTPIYKEKEKDLPHYIKSANSKRNPKVQLDEKVCPVIENKVTFDLEDRVLGCAKLFFESNSNIENFSKNISVSK